MKSLSPSIIIGLVCFFHPSWPDPSLDKWTTPPDAFEFSSTNVHYYLVSLWISGMSWQKQQPLPLCLEKTPGSRKHWNEIKHFNPTENSLVIDPIFYDAFGDTKIRPNGIPRVFVEPWGSTCGWSSTCHRGWSVTGMLRTFDADRGGVTQVQGGARWAPVIRATTPLIGVKKAQLPI